MNPDIKGIISDMDGVILDTEKLYVRFWCEAASFLRLSYGNAPRTQYSLNGSPVCNCKIKGLFRGGF